MPDKNIESLLSSALAKVSWTNCVWLDFNFVPQKRWSIGILTWPRGTFSPYFIITGRLALLQHVKIHHHCQSHFNIFIWPKNTCGPIHLYRNSISILFHMVPYWLFAIDYRGWYWCSIFTIVQTQQTTSSSDKQHSIPHHMQCPKTRSRYPRWCTCSSHSALRWVAFATRQSPRPVEETSSRSSRPPSPGRFLRATMFSAHLCFCFFKEKEKNMFSAHLCFLFLLF